MARRFAPLFPKHREIFVISFYFRYHNYGTCCVEFIHAMKLRLDLIIFKQNWFNFSISPIIFIHAKK